MAEESPIPRWDEIVEQTARELYQGKLAGGLSDDMIRAHAEYLMSGIERAFGGDSVAGVDEGQMKLLRENIFYFSGFKNLQQMKETTMMLVGADGKPVSWDNFKSAVLAIDQTYNVRYLEAEYHFATSASQSISFWNKAQAEKDALPDLRWSAVHDQRTRPSHMLLDGIRRPVDDPFWKTHWVPYDWNCRCTILQDPPGGEHTTAKRINELPPPKSFFAFNPGADNVIFPVDKDRFATVHPYAQNATKKETAAVIHRVKELLPMDSKKGTRYRTTAEDMATLRDMDVRINVSDAEAAKIINRELPGMNLLELVRDIDSAFDGTAFEGWASRSLSVSAQRDEIVHLDMRGSDGETRITRYFYHDSDGKWANHYWFELHPDLQDSSIGKEVLRALYKQYQYASIGRIDVHAGLDVGGYVWAKCGFEVKHREEVDRIMSKAQKMLSADEYEGIQLIYDAYYQHNPDGRAFPVVQFAAEPFMKKVLLGSNWHGTLNLKIKRNRINFERYIQWQK